MCQNPSPQGQRGHRDKPASPGNATFHWRMETGRQTDLNFKTLRIPPPQPRQNQVLLLFQFAFV